LQVDGINLETKNVATFSLFHVKFMNKKVMTAREALKIIKNGDTIAVSGFNRHGHPEELTLILEQIFLETGKPNNLTVIGAAGQGAGRGDFESLGNSHFGHEGMIRRGIWGHWKTGINLWKLAYEEKIEAYGFPQGMITHLYRDIAAGKPGTISHVGLGTFVDPRQSGGKLNNRTKEDLVQLIEINGKEWLLYKAFPINIGLIRGTTADERGNITIEHEGANLEFLEIAMAAKNSGGKVIAQVELVVKSKTLNPYLVKVPGALVDAVVVARPENHQQSFILPFTRAFTGDVRIPLSTLKPLNLNDRKTIARRVALSLDSDEIIALGGGISSQVGRVCAEEGIADRVVLKHEAGGY
jgi:propionate CoA-transferase